MEITNEIHRAFIEETQDFGLAESLQLSYCGRCAIPGILTLVPDGAPRRQFHAYANTMCCVELPVCPDCLEVDDLDPTPAPGILGCRDQGCLVAAGNWRAQQALLEAPLFYGYEAYPSAYQTLVHYEDDVIRGETLRPAGDIQAFETEEERDAWVEEGPTLIKSGFRFVVEYRARSAMPWEKGSRWYDPTDVDSDSCW